MIKIYKKYKEIINYLIAGGCTVLVSIVCYTIFTRLLHIHYFTSNILSWIVSVLFAYIVNRKFVFESISEKKEKITEAFNFFKYRILSLIIDNLLMYILIDILIVNDLISKMIVQVVVVILNYLFSKYIIFKK